MEFLRFGSSIPGGYWGCCACCIIQNFNFDPDEPAAIELVEGDGGNPLSRYNSVTGQYEPAFVGMTYKEIFETRIRIGTFDQNDMPNHAFFAILTSWQAQSEQGKKWMQILKDNGFEFVRTTDNSVYSGRTLLDGGEPSCSSHENYIFGLFRNISTGAVKDPFTPPKEWTDLAAPEGMVEAWTKYADQTAELTLDQIKAHTAIWKAGTTVIRSKAECEEAMKAAGTEITYAGQRSPMPQQSASERASAIKANPNFTPSEPMDW
jgi:hypothetical protein